jgi:hypothetical protein
MSAADALGPQFHDIKASELEVGHRLDSGRKTRIAKLHPRTDKIMAQTKTRGTRSPSVDMWDPDDIVRVWDPKPKGPST